LGNDGSGRTDSGHVRVFSWSGTAWVQAGADIDGEAANDQSGWSVSLSSDGSRVAIGAPANAGNGTEAGHVRVYSWNNSAWVQLGADIDGEVAGDQSGRSVSLSEDGFRIAISAIWNSGNARADSGHVRVYSWNGSAWVQLGADIDGEATDDQSGRSVSMSANGSRVAIGAPYNDGNGNVSGHVRVYQLNPWTQVNVDMNGAAALDRSGFSVSSSADGSRIAIGAPGNDDSGPSAGHVRVYQLMDNAWLQLGGDIDGEAAGDESGHSVSLSADGSRLAIGAPLNDGIGTNSGHVRVYSWNGSAWVQLGAEINGEALGDRAGHSVSLSPDGLRLAIGAPENDGTGSDSGHVRVYEWRTNSWVQLGAEINGEAAGDASGYSVSLSTDGARVAIGAPGNDVNSRLNSGHVRVYSWNGTSWVKLGDDIDGEAADDLSGWSVSMSGDGSRVAIGAKWNAGNGAESGHVRVYSWINSAWVQLGVDINGEAIGDESGHSVSLSTDGAWLAIGAPLNGGTGTNSGHVRIYSWNGFAWTLVTTDINGEAASDESGHSVSLSGNGQSVAIGAPNNNGNGSTAGHVRVVGTVQSLFTPAPSPNNPQQNPAPAPAPAPVPTPVTPTPSVTTAVVTAPSSASYRTGNAQVTLEWSAVSGAASYVVTTTSGSQVCATTTTSCVVNRLRNGRAYNYNVFAVNADGVRSATSTAVSARPGFQVRSTTVNARRTVSLSSIVTTPSKGRKTWTVTSGGCRVSGTRLVAPARAGSCKLRLSTTRSGAYGAMSTTINITVR
jgi:hypothetical protein